MKTRPARGHHKIPQFYLRGFADPAQPERVWVYRRRTAEGQIAPSPRGPFLESIENVCFEYDRFATTAHDGRVDHDSIEQELARQENVANPILERLRAREAMNRSDKEALASYMLLLYRRGENQRERQTETARKSAEDNVSLERLAWAAVQEGDLAKANDVFRNPHKYRDRVAQNVAAQGVTIQLELAEALLREMKWRFLSPPEGEFFITTDSPVCLESGLIRRHASVLFPVSSELLLLAGRWIDGADLAFGAADSGQMQVFNRFVMRQAFGEIYAREKTEWIMADLQMLADEAAPGAPQ